MGLDPFCKRGQPLLQKGLTYFTCSSGSSLSHYWLIRFSKGVTPFCERGWPHLVFGLTPYETGTTPFFSSSSSFGINPFPKKGPLLLQKGLTPFLKGVHSFDMIWYDMIWFAWTHAICAWPFAWVNPFYISECTKKIVEDDTKGLTPPLPLLVENIFVGWKLCTCHETNSVWYGSATRCKMVAWESFKAEKLSSGKKTPHPPKNAKQISLS